MNVRQAITTRYIAPTNFRGARISATASAGRKIFPWDHALNVEDNHRMAAKHFAFHFEWKGETAMGQTASGDYVTVFV